MPYRKGFTLIEIVVVLVIIGVLASIAMINYNTVMEQGMARAAGSNLMVMGSAEQNYYYSNGSYCTATSLASPACKLSTGDNNCADSLNAMICNMALNITDPNFDYSCLVTPGFTTYECRADSVQSYTVTIGHIIRHSPLISVIYDQPGPNAVSPNPNCAVSNPSHPDFCP